MRGQGTCIHALESIAKNKWVSEMSSRLFCKQLGEVSQANMRAIVTQWLVVKYCWHQIGEGLKQALHWAFTLHLYPFPNGTTSTTSSKGEGFAQACGPLALSNLSEPHTSWSD